ncbi:hypothetical protein EKD04_009695 [Chloroflexales bacterium ZM16-3]|nr:hypothetical protein [Chloroflexales bacterium ZM16-3]
MNLLHLIAIMAQATPRQGDFALEDIPAAIIGVLTLMTIIGVTQYIRDQKQQERQRRSTPQSSPPPVMQQRLPARVALPEPEAQAPPVPPQPNPQRLTASERRHTLVVGSEGDGKTQTQIAFLVGDISRGEQVIWASTNLALYHSRDQQTDLRPLAGHFEYTRDRMEIMAVLLWAAAEVDRRMPFYHEDMPHGDPVVIYVDELGGLYRIFGDLLVLAMRNIAEQGRKVDVFLFLVAHNTLKESTGLDLALKALFKTRLLGNVDQATWTAMVGPGIKLKGVPDGRGIWNYPDKRGNAYEISVRRPSAQEIAQIASRRARSFPAILDAAQPFRDRLEQAKAAPASQAAVAAAPAPTKPWEPTELHLHVRRLITDAMPTIVGLLADGQTLAKAQELTQTSNRALARRLGLGANGGTAAVRVGEMIREWETQGGVTLFDVPELAPAGRSDRSERAERPERPEHPERITPAA